jgi:ribosomal protein S18 acetylase RimI-like enzyme
MSLKIFEGNLNDKTHRINFIRLLNEYILDKMGGGKTFKGRKSEELANDLTDFPTFRLVFATIDEDYIGMAVYFFGYSTFNAKRLINIHDIIVSEKFRNMGIGRSMLEFIIEMAKKYDCCKITLEVRTDNENAKHLYSDLGFIESTPVMLFWHRPI